MIYKTNLKKMSEKFYSKENIKNITDSSLRGRMKFAAPLSTIKPEKDKAMMEHEAFHTSADKVQWDFTVKASSNIANADAFDALMKAADIDSDLLSSKADSKNRNNSYKR
jgi:hypothetical protein